MFQSWKSALYEYIRHRNQMEVDYSLQPLLPIVSDEAYMGMQAERLPQLAAWHQARGIEPAKSETRARLNKIIEREREGRIAAEIEYRKRRWSRNGPVEERIEKERVTLVRQNEQWTVGRIEAPVPEKPSARPGADCGGSTPFLNQQLLARHNTMHRNIRYDRERARQYADMWWNGTNPNFIEFEVDCTSFVSQCLYAGGIPMNYTGKREAGWWYRGRINHQEQWSFSWAVSHSLQQYLSNSNSGLKAEVVDAPNRLTIGDVIIYDWDGDSKFQHSTVVTAMDAFGYPLVNAHTMNSKHRSWDYRDSYAWSEKTTYRFFHIADFV